MSNDMCEELIVEIFSRLPSRTLVRCRSLSKSVCACIGSPGFIRLHILRSQKMVMLKHKPGYRPINIEVYTMHLVDGFPYNLYVGVTRVDYPFLHYVIVGSCNGIVCLYSHGYDGIILWNPSIRRKVIVQYPPNYDYQNWYVFGFGFGFFFDPMVDDYKILLISKPTSFVYTLKTGTWREISSLTSPFSYVVPYSPLCLSNGALHFAVNKGDSSLVSGVSYYIMKFDLSSEVFSKIELPEPRWKTCLVTVSDGWRLAAVSSKDDGTSIWVMREYSNPASWHVVFKLNKYEVKGWARVFQLTASDDLLITHPLEGRVVHINSETHKRSWLQNLSYSSSVTGMTLYVESLELLDTGTSC